MQSPIFYAKAPIIEAILDLRVTPVEGFNAEQFLVLNRALGEDSQANRVSFNQVEFQVEFGQGASEPRAERTEQFTGFMFTQKDEHQAFQARLDGFTFRRRAPYGQWRSFRDESSRIWNDYRSLYPFEGVVRTALRYINRIDIPLESGLDLSTYLRVLPDVPSDFPGSGSGTFFMQMQFWQDDLKCALILNEALVPPPDGKTVSVILDFDLFQERSEHPWSAEDNTQLWDFIEKLRVRKNQLFEASITTTLKERIR